MTYEYKCESCKRYFDVIKSVKDMERNENCPKCGEFGIRQFIPEVIHFNKTKVTHAEYNPGLGCVVKNEAHKRDIMKRKGVVEIGNDYGSGEKMQALSEKARQEKFKKRYDDV